MSSIPLPALAIQPPQQQQSPLEIMAHVMGIRAKQQELQTGELQQQGLQQENQMKALQLQDQQTLRNTAKGIDWTAPDAFTKLMQGAQQGGVSPQTLSALALQRAQYQEQLAKTDTATLASDAERNNQLLGHIDAVKGVTDPAKRAQVAQTQAQQILNNPDIVKGIKDPGIQQMLGAMAQGQLVPNDDQLESFEMGLMDHKTQVEMALKQKQGEEAGAKTAQAEAETRFTNTKNDQMMKFGGMGGEQAKARYLFVQSKVNQGQPVSPEDQAFAKAYEQEKKIVPIANFNLQMGAGGGLSDPAVDQAAQRYLQTGQLPPAGGRGPAALAQNRKIMNRAAELGAGQDITQNATILAANRDSLKKLQSNFDQVTAFENTAGKNLDTFLTTAKKVVDSGSPMVNRPLRSLAGSAMGSADQAAFNAARTTALTEISKVLNSSNAQGVLSDSARHEVEGLIGPDATLAQIYSAAKILKQDMANRHDAYSEQIQDIHGRLGGAKKEQPSTTGADPFAQFGGKAH